MSENQRRNTSRISFGATAPPFLDYLKDILSQYPDGQILKELIQNADDAQATKVVFIHDERSYGTGSLWTEELSQCQGPALFAYNNAAFTDDDWQGIQKAGRSIKRDDPNTVGKFGIGFNSVYHTTDVPAIFSSGHLGFMDPQEKIFGDRTGGFLWSLDNAEDRNTLMTLHDQFQPFRDIVSLVSEQDWSKVVMEDQYFDGTLFRFPLRNKVSEISDNLYDSVKVTELFNSFITDADLSLLFLKSVTSVSVLHISVNGIVNTRLEVNCSVSPEVPLESKDEPQMEGLTKFKVTTLKSKEPKETKWLVTTCTMKEGIMKDLDVLGKKLSFLPRVDLAFPCGDRRGCSDSRLSCFLPLPNNEANRTGLPVHINACFGLTANRRHIKWKEEDQRHDEHALWNELLMKEVLPRAYVMIIQDAVKLAQRSLLPISSVYDLWPDIGQTEQKDKWNTVALDVLHHLFEQNVAVLSLAKNEREFITPSEAVLPCNGPTSIDILSAIRKTLVYCGENLVTLTASCARAIKMAYPNAATLKQVTPAFIRNILRSGGVQHISNEDKLYLLEYILSDGKYQNLKGLQLLPVSDGSFRSFTDREEDTALIDSNEFPRTLLPCCRHLFIPDDLSPPCRISLKEMASKNLFKVINVDADCVAEFTKRFLPEEWKQTSVRLVQWDINNTRHPPLNWVQEFWKFLNTHASQLSCFTEIPLIPISPLSVSEPATLGKLRHKTTLIFEKSKGSSLPVQVAELVETVGGIVVRGNEWLKHDNLDSFVLHPSPRSVLKVLMNLDSQHLIRELETVSDQSREEFKDYLSHLDSLSNEEKRWLLELPLFQTVRGNCVAAHSKKAVLQLSGLTIPRDLPVPDSVIRCATEVDRRLLQFLQIKFLDTAEAANVLINCIQDQTCDSGETEKIMTWVLQHGNILFSQNKPLKQSCKNLKFMEVNRELKNASSFFDPRNETFKVIFESDFFPPPSYTKTQQMLESLRELGLKNKEAELLPEHVLHAARLIDKLHSDSQTEALNRAQVLLEMLSSSNLLSKFSFEQVNHLKMLKCIPCDHHADGKNLLSGQSQTSLYCAEEMRHSQFEDIVGYVMPLVGNLSPKVSDQLGLKVCPPPEKVMQNLSVLKAKAQKMTNPNTNGNFKKQLYSIYKHMQDNIWEFASLMNKDIQWVWDSNEFVSPQDLVLEYPQNLDLSSYIRKVPNEYLPFKQLMLKLGLKTSLSTNDIFGILNTIQKTIEERQEPFATSSEVKASIEILNWLWREKKPVHEDIPVPVIIGRGQISLKPCSSAVFCDVSKTGLKELDGYQETIHVIHEEIPKATAEWLNIQLLSTHILDPEIVGLEQCGQSEPITTRIKNILKEYDEESDIFKELIQNAEDAGANVCKFLVDFRVHKDAPESLIDPDMALCQGPCLWAFNNEQFTAEDWKNIVRVGSASKENKVEKIGKFGLGFNTVYHVTDIPSILSGNHLLILDPNVTHLKKHIKHQTNPGIKLDLSQQRLFHWFPGQFGPYERIFDCEFTRQGIPEPYSGTLIKLPFRCEEEAAKSEISTKVYQRHDIITLQQNFTSNSQSHLLFLKNIDTLSLQSISSNVSTPPRDDEIQTTLTLSKTTASTMRIPDETSEYKQRHAEKLLMKLDQKCKEVIDSCTLRIVQISSQQSGETQVQHWLLYNCFGTWEALKMALKDNKFSLPIGGIAVPLQYNPETGKLTSLKADLIGQAFCFLPLQIQTGLPVNVNGTFAVTSNRKSLWDSGVKNQWNRALLNDPVVTAYVTTLLALRKMSENNQLEAYCYHDFWPDREKVNGTFKPLVDAFYVTISQNSNSPELFSDGEHWCSMNNAIFLHESIEENENIGALAAQVCKKFVKAPNYVVPLPQWLRNNFKQAGLQKILQDRIWNWEKFYQDVVFKNLREMDPESRETLVLHAIDLNIKEVDHLLLQYPCVPTTNGQLQFIWKLVNPSGKVSCLFEAEDGRLLDGTKKDFCTSKRIQRLLGLGMASDRLSLEDIAERAGTVAQTWSVDKHKAYKQVKCLLELMKIHVDDEDSPHWEELKTISFLPALSPRTAQKAKTVKLERPTDVFSDKCTLLVNMTYSVLHHTKLNIHNLDPVLQILGVHHYPDLETVIQQLFQASQLSKSIDKSVLHNMANECYSFLDQWILDYEDATRISECANCFPFILIGDGFVEVSRVAKNEQFEAKPYLYALPRAFARFEKLWESIGVKETFTMDQYQTVFQELQSQHGNKRLPQSDLLICLTILNKIHESKEKPACDWLIPNDNGVLQHASELCFNDSQWMPVTSEVTLCHEKISRVVARHFRIKTTRHYTLEKNIAEDLPLHAFQFEQQEQLTVRIKNIISAYPSKKDIVKELIQNADDAEATEIHFVWDKRHHGKEKTFGKKWNPLQGPSLCVFNNKVFSNDDLMGIQQLGEGGKQNSAGKVGKYGVGFNSVYHLTDCPSILTGDEKLCISDPNQKHIESHSGKPPVGIGYNLSEELKNMHSDVYKSFLPDKFPLKEGTMFRLPLRMGSYANSSKISQQGVTENDMKELCSSLSLDPESFILFLKNICKIQVHKIEENSENLETIFEVEKNVQEKSKAEKEAFVKLLQQALESDERVAPQKAFYEIVISASARRQSTWIVAEQFGSFKDDVKMKPTDKLPHAALAARLKSYPILPSSSVFRGQYFCTLPMPGKTGLPVHVNGNFEVDAARKNLWTEDGQSLKINWNEALKQNVIAPLYADLLYHIRCTIPLIKVPFSSITFCFVSSYLCFWPTVSKDVAKDWHEMTHEVYRAIKNKRLDVIPVMRSTTRTIAGTELKECSFDWSDINETEPTKAPYLTQSSSDVINPILEDLGMKLVPHSAFMDIIWTSFRSAGVDVRYVHHTTVRRFLTMRPLNDPAQTDKDLPLPITDTLIKNKKRCSELLSFCLADLKDWKVETKGPKPQLDGLPLLLTADGVLQVFNSNSPKMMSSYECIFLSHQAHFADFETNWRHMDVLQTLNLVKSLSLAQAAQYLKPVIQYLLQTCEVDPHSGLHAPDERMLKWLEHLWKYLINEIEQRKTSEEEQSLTLGDVRKLFSDCCVLPVMCPRLNNKRLLQTMKEMSSVVPFSSDKDLISILFKLGFMTRDSGFCSTRMRQIYSHELMKLDDKSSVLDQVCNINHSEFSRLSSEEMAELQTFFQSVGFKAKSTPEYKKKLRSLPIFETIYGKRVRIDGPKEIFVLNCAHSSEFPDLYNLADNNSIFLKHSTVNSTLSEMMNFQTLDDMKYFMKFILPAIHRLTEQQCLHCLKLLVSRHLHLDSCKDKDQIISTLKTVRLICSSQGRLETASYFSDDSVALFKTMLPKEKFVPERFWIALHGKDERKRDRAKKLVRELGMKDVVTKDDFIKFALQLESEAKTHKDLKEVKEKSSFLFQEALRATKEMENGLLQSLCGIKFLFPVKIAKNLCDYSAPLAEGRTTVAIKGSLIENNPEHQNLIWTSMPIIKIPLYMIHTLKDRMESVGAFHQPPSNCVTRNMRNICQVPCETEELIKTRADVFRSSYVHLQGNGFKEQELNGIPLVLVEKDTALLRADACCFSLLQDVDFRPYLYKIPPKYIVFEGFFKRIGVENDATVVQYCNVLAAIHADSCDKPHLNPNQQNTVKQTVKHLFHLIESDQNQPLFDKVKTLYLPAVDGKLYPSSTLYYNDTVFESKRVEEALENKTLLLERLSKCHLGDDIYKHQQLLKLLPPKFQPKMLSGFIKEKAVESLMEICDAGVECEFRGWFEEHLSSDAFSYGLISLIRQQSDGKISQEEAKTICEEIFGSIQIVCCKTLETKLWLGEEQLDKTASETDVFVKKRCRECIFYLKHNDERAPKVLNEVNMTLTKEINALLGNALSSTYFPVLGHLLMCDDLHDVQKCLAKHGILDCAEIKNLRFDPPDPGTDIPVEWHDCLDMGILNNFEEGEFVGYDRNGKYIYAVIVEEVPGDFGPLSRRYNIDIGMGEPIEVGCLDLYQFKRVKKVKLEERTSSGACCMTLEKATGPVPPSSQQSTRHVPANLEEALREIDKCLAEIRSLPSEEERKKATRRLYLRWHPDKNPDCEFITTEAFKYLLNQLKEPDRVQRESAGSYHSGGYSDFRPFYQQWNQEAHRHRRGRERFSSSFRSYNFWSHNRDVPQPNMPEAKRWCRQARCDLKAAYNDVDKSSTEWCLFKIHQAVEKSLTAAGYKQNGQPHQNSSISATAARLSLFIPKLRDLPQIVKDLKSLGVDPKKTQYPNCHPSPHIPNEQFDSQNERAALTKASELLDKVEAYVY